MTNRDESFGCITFTIINGITLYVIIKSLAGDYGFPKGHLEKNETEEQAAMRETYEEVGINVEIIQGFREEIEYSISKKNYDSKIVTFFIGTFSNQEFNIQKEEISAVKLMTYDEAISTLSFNETKSLLKQAHRYISDLAK